MEVGAEVGPATRPLTVSRVLRLASLVFLGVLPVLTIITLFVAAIQDDTVAFDFRQFYGAGEAILRGHNPYDSSAELTTNWGGPYPYPPLPALAAVPLTALSLDAAGVLVMAMLVGVALAVPFVLGVRDWRCYGLMLLWPPVISAIQTANVTLWFGLAAAVMWRYRDRVVPVSIALGLTLAAKFFLWPLVVWLAATRRALSAAGALVFGAVVLVLSWAVIGFAGFLDYPHLLRQLERAVGDDSYTVYIVGLDAGLPSPVARALWLFLGLVLVAGSPGDGRRGDERSAFILAISAASR